MKKVIQEIGKDLLFAYAANLVDAVTTRTAVQKNMDESNKELKQGFETGDIGATVAEMILTDAVATTLRTGLAYTLDRFLGIEEDRINFHHAVTYGEHSIKALAGLSNLARIRGNSEIAEVLGTIPRAYIKATGQEDKYEL